MHSPYTSRRRRRRHTLAYALCIGVGLAVGLGGSMVRPGHWWRADDPLNAPQRPPAPREVLCVAGDCAYVLDALPFGDDRVAVVLWLRGRTGRDAYRVTDCSQGEGVVVPLADERRRQRWQRDGDSIVDRIGAAACGPAAAS